MFFAHMHTTDPTTLPQLRYGASGMRLDEAERRWRQVSGDRDVAEALRRAAVELGPAGGGHHAVMRMLTARVKEEAAGARVVGGGAQRLPLALPTHALKTACHGCAAPSTRALTAPRTPPQRSRWARSGR